MRGRVSDAGVVVASGVVGRPRPTAMAAAPWRPATTTPAGRIPPVVATDTATTAGVAIAAPAKTAVSRARRRAPSSAAPAITDAVTSTAPNPTPRSPAAAYRTGTLGAPAIATTPASWTTPPITTTRAGATSRSAATSAAPTTSPANRKVVASDTVADVVPRRSVSGGRRGPMDAAVAPSPA